MKGIINLDKPAGPSCAAVLNRLKRLLPRGVKIGHAGTLDPFATGVLVVLIGREATRLSDQFMGQPKQYIATVKLGAFTETLDPDSPETAGPAITPPDEQTIRTVLARSVGEIDQVPPAYSALWIDGKRAYKLARSGQEVSLQSRKVHVYGAELMRYAFPHLEVRIDCGKGTYIRSIARDIAADLGTTGYLTALRRTRVGSFTSDTAVGLDALLAEGLEAFLLPIPDRQMQ